MFIVKLNNCQFYISKPIVHSTQYMFYLFYCPYNNSLPFSKPFSSVKIHLITKRNGLYVLRNDLVVSQSSYKYTRIFFGIIQTMSANQTELFYSIDRKNDSAAVLTNYLLFNVLVDFREYPCSQNKKSLKLSEHSDNHKSYLDTIKDTKHRSQPPI